MRVASVSSPIVGRIRRSSVRTLTLEEATLVSGGEMGFNIIDPMNYEGVDDDNVPGIVGTAAFGGAVTMDESTEVSPVIVTGRKGDVVTVTTRVAIDYSGSLPGFIGGGGSISGTIPAGATITGKDKNNNNVPDLMEYFLRTNRMRYRNIPPGSNK